MERQSLQNPLLPYSSQHPSWKILQFLLSVQPAHVAEYMGPAPAVTCAHVAPVVEYATAAPAIFNAAPMVTCGFARDTRNSTSVLPTSVEYAQPSTRPLPATTVAVAHRQVGEKPADDMVSEMRDFKSDLVHIRELLGVLVRKERCAETRAEIAARRLDRMERGEIVFSHASAVQGAVVFTKGTDAWVQVVNDDARAQGGTELGEPGGEIHGWPRGTKWTRTR